MTTRTALRTTNRSERHTDELLVRILSQRVAEFVEMEADGVDLSVVEKEGRASRLEMYKVTQLTLDAAQARLDASA